MTATLERAASGTDATSVPRGDAEPYVLTADALRALDACHPYVDRFRRAYPRGVALTTANLLRGARNPSWNLTWLANAALDSDGWDRFHETLLAADKRLERALVQAHERYPDTSDERHQRASRLAWGRYRAVLARAIGELLPEHVSARFVRATRGGNRG